MKTISTIRARRLLLGLHLADVAAPSKVSVSFLSRFERGQRGASNETLRRLAATLELPLETLSSDDAEGSR